MMLMSFDAVGIDDREFESCEEGSEIAIIHDSVRRQGAVLLPQRVLTYVDTLGKGDTDGPKQCAAVCTRPCVHASRIIPGCLYS